MKLSENKKFKVFLCAKYALSRRMKVGFPLFSYVLLVPFFIPQSQIDSIEV